MCGLLVPLLVLMGPATIPGAAPPDGEDASAPESDCSFAIRAKNNMSFDVWVDLYDSTVRLESWAVPALLRGNRQLKIQNHRISTGKTMDRRYTAPGSCSTRRSWTFYVRIGGRDVRQVVGRSTKGTEWRDRIVDLGDSSDWGL
jgi:hypothetical protein